jgi:hypothetical protein
MNKGRPGFLGLLVLMLVAGIAVGEEVVRVPAGAVLRQVASPVGLAVAVVEEAAELPVIDRSGGWVRVALDGVTGWVDLAGGGAGAGEIADGSGAPVHSASRPGERSPAPDGPSERAASPGKAPEAAAIRPFLADTTAQRLAEARVLLAGRAEDRAWGRFAIVTDAARHPLLPLGERLAGELPALYARRYGLAIGDSAGDPAAGGASLGTAVLFAREADYRAFLALVDGAVAGTDVAGSDLAGHAAAGVAALPLADRTAGQAGALLVHELTHLLSQAALGPHLPPWLDEGLAGDLELVEIGADGSLDESRWAEGPTRYRGQAARTGPLLALGRLLANAARGRLETLPELAAIDRPRLLASPRRAELYALSALWVRFLLAEPGRADGFRAFLAGLAASPAPPLDGGAAALGRSLGSELPALERPFRVWLADLARRFDPDPERRPSPGRRP